MLHLEGGGGRVQNLNIHFLLHLHHLVSGALTDSLSFCKSVLTRPIYAVMGLRLCQLVFTRGDPQYQAAASGTLCPRIHGYIPGTQYCLPSGFHSRTYKGRPVAFALHLSSFMLHVNMHGWSRLRDMSRSPLTGYQWLTPQQCCVTCCSKTVRLGFEASSDGDLKLYISLPNRRWQ